MAPGWLSPGQFPRTIEARKCAQFCAHHQTLPSATECHEHVEKPCCMRHLSHSVILRGTLSKLLILGATITYKQEVAGSSPALPTILCFVFRSTILLGLHQSDVADGAVRVTVGCLDHQPVADHSQPLCPAVLQPIRRN